MLQCRRYSSRADTHRHRYAMQSLPRQCHPCHQHPTGTENVDADLANGLVTVTGSTPTEEIIRTIESLGFEVKKEG